MMDEADFDFRHLMRDTVILLGGRVEIADMLARSLDCGITDADVEELKRYNLSLVDGTKSKLDNISKMVIRRSQR